MTVPIEYVIAPYALLILFGVILLWLLRKRRDRPLSKAIGTLVALAVYIYATSGSGVVTIEPPSDPYRMFNKLTIETGNRDWADIIMFGLTILGAIGFAAYYVSQCHDCDDEDKSPHGTA